MFGLRGPEDMSLPKDGEDKRLTCFSCSNYTMGGCLEMIVGWPELGPESCGKFEYEPGSDETERYE